MDDIVRQAIAKWPHVPDCYGWLGLDARGHWYMRDDAAQAAGPFPQSRGSRLLHEKLIDFIHRNYESDAEGRWFFQNGPQRVYVELEATPLIWRLDAPQGTPQAHTGLRMPDAGACLVDEAGRVYLASEAGLGWSIRWTCIWWPTPSSRGAGRLRRCVLPTCRSATASCPALRRCRSGHPNEKAGMRAGFSLCMMRTKTVLQLPDAGAAGAGAAAAPAGARGTAFGRSSGRPLGDGELGAGRIRHVGHAARDLGVVEVAATLGRHGTLALERRMHQRFEALLDAGRPGRHVAELGRAGRAGGMAGRALALEDLFAVLRSGRLASRISTEPTFWMRSARAFSGLATPCAGLLPEVTNITRPMMANTGSTKEKAPSPAVAGGS